MLTNLSHDADILDTASLLFHKGHFLRQGSQERITKSLKKDIHDINDMHFIYALKRQVKKSEFTRTTT